VAGEAKPFYPYHALKDTIVCAAVFAVLITFAIVFRPPLDAVADPTDSTYVPRPEWYFLSLFQMLKYFPGPLEPVATMVIPGLVVGGLLALPFLDRRPDRHPLKRPIVLASFAIVGAGISTLTYLGLKDTPRESQDWSPLAIAGLEFSRDQRCVKCHRAGGVANMLDETRMRKEPGWTLGHVRDPEMITVGLRPVPDGGMSDAQAHAILSYMREVRGGGAAPIIAGGERTASVVLGRYCASCHMIDGEGASSAPDLSNVGARHDINWLRRWIASPEDVDPLASMPAFGEILSAAEMDALTTFLAARK